MPVKEGDTVKVEYKGMLEDGTVFDSSEKNGPLEFKVGEGKLVKGFEKAVIGLEKDQEIEVILQPEEAYGEHNPHLIQEVPSAQMPENAQPGMLIGIHLKDGNTVPAKIVENRGEMTVIDLNSPLAGKTLKFKIKLVG